MATAASSNAPDGILDKVRALLAKAESTQFEAEAEAFTAKAQELMTRHRIDRAVLNASDDLGDAPAGRRLGIDDPYADVRQSMQRLHLSPFVADKEFIRGFVYDVDTGRLEEVSYPGPTGPTSRPPVPWSLAALRIEKASRRPSERVAVATAMGSAPIVMPPTATAVGSSWASTLAATSAAPMRSVQLQARFRF